MFVACHNIPHRLSVEYYSLVLPTSENLHRSPTHEQIDFAWIDYGAATFRPRTFEYYKAIIITDRRKSELTCPSWLTTTQRRFEEACGKNGGENAVLRLDTLTKAAG